MSEVPTNLNTYSTALNNVLAASDGSTDELSAINSIVLSGEGIDAIIESFSEENPEFAKALKNNKDKLKKPDVELSELRETDIEIPKELAEKLGLAGTQMTDSKIKTKLCEFTQAASKECLKENDNDFLGNLNSLMIDLMCVLLCQDSKSQLIETLKETLNSKKAERANLSNEYLAKTLESVKEQVDALKAAEKAKLLSLISAIANAILSAAIAAVSIVFAAATCGAGASVAAIALAAVAITASVVSVAASTASATCSCISIKSENLDQATKSKLENAILGLGVVSAVFGLIGGGAEIAGSVVSTAAKAGANAAIKAGTKVAKEIAEETLKKAGEAAAKAAAEKVGKSAAKEGLEAAAKEAAKEAVTKALKESGEEIAEDTIKTIAEETAEAVAKRAVKGDLIKFLDKLDFIVTLGNSLMQGATNIGSGILNLEAAKHEKELANIKIEMAKLDQEIETLKEFINVLMQDIQKFMEDYLKNEEEAANILQDKSDTERKIAQQPA